MFVDHIKIYAKAGDGGNGCCSFRREKFVPKGGPDGGDGGHGGDIILVVDHHIDNLKEFFYRPRQKAERGANGRGQRCTGRSGVDLILKVPAGTVIYRVPTAEEHGDADPFFEERAEDKSDEEADVFDDETDEEFDDEDSEEFDDENSEEFDDHSEESDEFSESDDDFASELDPEAEEEIDEEDEPGGYRPPLGEVIADLTTIGERFMLCRGGGGGKGNWNFRTDTNQAPIEFTKGELGEEGQFYLELRRIADVGLVGFPNAGKSTLLGALSNATPKVASYPFTTLTPMVGVVEFPGFRRTTVADIPGLIEGAHANIGLGHDFLRHISRCSVFLFVVDTAGVDMRDPISDLEILRRELRLYDEDLGKREWMIVANKIDLEESALFLEAIADRFPKQEIFPISAQHGDGLEALRERLCVLSGRPE